MKIVKYPDGRIEEVPDDLALTHITVPRLVDERGGARHTGPDDRIPTHHEDEYLKIRFEVDEYAPILVHSDEHPGAYYEYRRTAS